MAFGVKVKGGGPIKIKLPTDPRFWTGIGLEVARTIRVEAEKGVDVNGRAFKPYTKQYADARSKKGRGRKPNLAFTGRMLSSIGQGVRGMKGKVLIRMSGEQGRKAWHNTVNGRDFFGINNKARKRILVKFKARVAKDNQLK